MEGTVTVRGQTAIPVAIRRRYNIKAKTKLECIDDGHTITVLTIPEDSIKVLKGKFKGADLLKFDLCTLRIKKTGVQRWVKAMYYIP